MGWVTEILEIKWRGPVVLAGSLVLLSDGAVDLLQAISSAKWPKAPGRILTSQIVSGRFYHPAITYVYTVGNTSYTGNTYRWGDTYYWKRQTAEPAVQTYAPGSTVFVSFDPSRPERSVLEPGVTPDAVSRIEWFLPILLIAAWMVRMDLKRVRARRLIQSKRPAKFHV
jgi:hypothetical protein